MKEPKHHFPDEVLLEYVAGNTAEAVSLAIAVHASLCEACRWQLALLERMGGALVEAAEPAEMRGDALERLLARLDDEPHAGEPAPVVAPPGLDYLPRPLWPYLASDSAVFKPVVPGIATIELGIAPRAGTARLVQLDPAVVIPHHDHGGPEYGVLLRGGLRDGEADLHRGDVFYKTPGDVHEQSVLPGELCIALVINEGSLIPLTPAGDVLKLFSR
jgi:putative transcriptional regulator